MPLYIWTCSCHLFCLPSHSCLLLHLLKEESAPRDTLSQELLVVMLPSSCRSVSCFSRVEAVFASGVQYFFYGLDIAGGMGRGARWQWQHLLLHACCTWPGLLLFWSLSSVKGEGVQENLVLLLSLGWWLSHNVTELHPCSV